MVSARVVVSAELLSQLPFETACSWSFLCRPRGSRSLSSPALSLCFGNLLPGGRCQRSPFRNFCGSCRRSCRAATALLRGHIGYQIPELLEARDFCIDGGDNLGGSHRVNIAN